MWNIARRWTGLLWICLPLSGLLLYGTRSSHRLVANPSTVVAAQTAIPEAIPGDPAW